MAVKTVPVGGARRPDEKLAALRTRLLAEWNNDAADAQAVPGAPEIRQETDRAGHIVHVYVVWDEWGHLDQVRRSELITDAFIDKYGESALMHLTVAMGLTADEAQRMGIE